MGEDQELLTTLHARRATGGDRDSLVWLIGRFAPLLLAQAEYRLGATLRRHVDPEDLVGDVWLRALPRLVGIVPHAGPGSRVTPVVLQFLSTTLLNRVRDLYDKHLAGKPIPLATEVVAPALGDASASGPTADQTGVVSAAVRNEQQGTVRAALAALPAADREVVVLRGIEQRSNQQVALLLGITPDAASMRYRRALDRLREQVSDLAIDEQ